MNSGRVGIKSGTVGKSPNTSRRRGGKTKKTKKTQHNFSFTFLTRDFTFETNQCLCAVWCRLSSRRRTEWMHNRGAEWARRGVPVTDATQQLQAEPKCHWHPAWGPFASARRDAKYHFISHFSHFPCLLSLHIWGNICPFLPRWRGY